MTTPTTDADDLYEILGVAHGADEEAIAAAVRTSRKRWRQLTGPPDRERAHLAEERMAQLELAETTLLDEASRRRYDASLSARHAAQTAQAQAAISVATNAGVAWGERRGRSITAAATSATHSPRRRKGPTSIRMITSPGLSICRRLSISSAMTMPTSPLRSSYGEVPPAQTRIVVVVSFSTISGELRKQNGRSAAPPSSSQGARISRLGQHGQCSIKGVCRMPSPRSGRSSSVSPKIRILERCCMKPATSCKTSTGPRTLLQLPAGCSHTIPQTTTRCVRSWRRLMPCPM